VTMKILLLSDIHANFPALRAVMDFFVTSHFDAICNCGDSLVYGPFPNETLYWLQTHNVHSIVGNTDIKVKKLLQGKTFKKPSKPEKRIMYEWTAKHLDASSKKYLLTLKKTGKLNIGGLSIGLFHGSPANRNEFLFPDTPKERFRELANQNSSDIIICGHSHTPFHQQTSSTHFINPGSIGRMFDSNPAASCAVLCINNKEVKIDFHRIRWPIKLMAQALQFYNLPAIYLDMYKSGRKLN